MSGKSLKYIDFEFSRNKIKYNFHIQMKDRIEFDLKSSLLALEICRIHLKLSISDEFCSAVSKEDHFYSPELFDTTIQKVFNVKKISNATK